MSKKKRSTKEQIVSHLKTYDKSGLSVTAYCRKHDIAYATFYKWRSRYKNSTPLKEPNQSFIPLNISLESSQCENVIAKIEHRKGYSISFYQDCPTTFVAEMLKQL